MTFNRSWHASGTASINNAETSVTGQSSTWSSSGIREGDYFYAAGYLVPIASVASNTSLTLTDAWPGANRSAAAYKIIPATDSVRTAVASRTVLDLLTNGNISSIAGLTSAADKVPYYTGSGAAALATLTAAGRALIDDASASAQRTTLGLGTAAEKNTGTSGNAVPLLNVANTFSAAQAFETSSVYTAVATMQATATGASYGPTLDLKRVNSGPAASDQLGYLRFYGSNSAAGSLIYAGIRTHILDATSGSEDGQLNFNVVINGSIAAGMILGPGLTLGSPTGGDKGWGSINAKAVYDDNTLLSCYPFDAYLDGEVDFAKWDGKVLDEIVPATFKEVTYDTGEKDENGKAIIGHKSIEVTPEGRRERQHKDARKFASRLGTEYDPLDIDKYTQHWKDKRHLSSMPNEAKFDPEKGMPAGAWVQRLVETVEIQAIHIAKLNDRLKVVEAALAAMQPSE